jgi:hypothetical protein
MLFWGVLLEDISPSAFVHDITPSTPDKIFNESHIGAAIYSQTQALKLFIWNGVLP